MMRFFRKHHTSLMIVIAVLAIPFIFYFNKSDFSQKGSGDLARVYGRKLSMDEARHYQRLQLLAAELGMSGLIQDLTAGARDDNERALNFILNLLILRHESERLGIQPTPSAIADYVRQLPAFHSPSGFDLKKYSEFVQETLAPHGFSEAEVEELARDQLALNQIKGLVATGISVPESEINTTFGQAYGLMNVSVVRLKTADFLKDLKITDEDIQKYFDTRKAELKTDEKRKVEFVNLALSDEQKKLAGKERIDALQKLSDRATDFTQALLEKGADFHQVATKFQLPIQATNEFTTVNPDPKLKADGKLGTATFQLTSEEPISEPIQVADGYYILHLTGVSPSRPLTLEEAKPKIVDSLKASGARQALTNKGAQASRELREGLKAGEPLGFAAEKVNVKPEKVPPFILMDDLDPNELAAKADEKKDKPADLIAIKNAAYSLQPGDVSEFFPWEDGGIIAILEKRDPPDEAKFGSKKKDLAERIERNKRETVFYEWLRERQKEGVVIAGPPREAKKS
jgi:peptidyl-prolyl cis-trans isomerase D